MKFIKQFEKDSKVPATMSVWGNKELLYRAYYDWMNDKLKTPTSEFGDIRVIHRVVNSFSDTVIDIDIVFEDCLHQYKYIGCMSLDDEDFGIL